MNVRERISLLRQRMTDEGIDYVLIGSSDYHASEYVGDYFKVSEFFSGCTSDNVTLIIGADIAELWTDGRYFISAENELKGSGIHLMKMGEPDVPKVTAYLKNIMSEGTVLAFDGRCIGAGQARMYKNIASSCGAVCRIDFEPAEGIWTDRPDMPKHPVYMLPEELLGESFEHKTERVRKAMAEKKASYFMLSKLDDIAWLLGARGNDIYCNPVMLSYALIGMETFDLFIQDEEVTEEFAAFAEKSGIALHPYDSVIDFLRETELDGPVMFEESATSACIADILCKKGKVIKAVNPTELMKAMKNPVEVEKSREFYLKDSVQLCRFLCWFDHRVDALGEESFELNELTAAEKLDSLRAEVPGFIGLSFPTISAYGANAAMAHYSATPENYAVVEKKGFYLVDSGGQYMGATTDVTRTVVCGPLTEVEKRDFTLVTVANLNLLNAKFLHGTTGRFLDAYARAPLWDLGLNFNHGTGHGIGYILNVHEGPQNIRYQYGPGMKEAVFEEGMIVSDEPGMYVENSHGIRLETILLTAKDEMNEYGQFMRFEPLTFAPIDTRAIDVKYMQPRDIERLNSYNRQVYEKISPYLSGDELEWLANATKPLGE